MDHAVRDYYRVISEERTVLESLFSSDEVKFSLVAQREECPEDAWDVTCIYIQDEDVTIKMSIDEAYPLSPVSISLSGDVTSTTVKDLLDIGAEVAARQAGLNEVAVYAVFSSVKEHLYCSKYPLMAPPLSSGFSEDSVQLSSERPRPVGVSLKFLLRFAMQSLITGFDKYTKADSAEATGSVCARLVVEVTRARKCSYVDLGGPMISASDVGEATFFVSHAWRCPFASLVTSLFGHQLGSNAMWALVDGHVDAERMLARLEEHLSQGITENYYWVDIFCKNQHKIQSDDTADELQRTVACIQSVLLVLNPLNDPVLLSRVWCLFEMCEAMKSEVDIAGVASIGCMLELNDIIMRERSTNATTFHHRGKTSGQSRTKKSFPLRMMFEEAEVGADFTGSLRRVLQACYVVRQNSVKNIDIQTAQATVADDRAVILTKIEATVGISTMNSTARQLAEDCIRHCQAGALDAWARSRKSGRWEAAAVALRQAGPGEQTL